MAIFAHLFLGSQYLILAAVGVSLFFFIGGIWPKWIGVLLAGFVLFELWWPVRLAIGYKSSMVGLVIPFRIKDIMSNGKGNRLRLREPGSTRALDFIKQIPLRGLIRFFMRLDSRCCSPEEFKTVQRVLRQLGIRYRIEENLKRGSQYFLVECGQDAAKAIKAGRAVLIDVFGLPADGKVQVSLIGQCTVRGHKMLGWGRGFIPVAWACRPGIEDQVNAILESPIKRFEAPKSGGSVGHIDACEFRRPKGWSVSESPGREDGEYVSVIENGTNRIAIRFRSRSGWFETEAPYEDVNFFSLCELDAAEVRADYETDKSFFDAALGYRPAYIDVDRLDKEWREEDRRKLAMLEILHNTRITHCFQTPHCEGFSRLKTIPRENRYEGVLFFFTPEGELLGKMTIDGSPICDEVARCIQCIIGSFRHAPEAAMRSVAVLAQEQASESVGRDSETHLPQADAAKEQEEVRVADCWDLIGLLDGLQMIPYEECVKLEAREDRFSKEVIQDVFRQYVKPDYESRPVEKRVRYKASLRYFLTTRDVILLDDIILMTRVPPLTSAPDPYVFFMWLWEVLFPGEDCQVWNPRQWKVNTDLREGWFGPFRKRLKKRWWRIHRSSQKG